MDNTTTNLNHTATFPELTEDEYETMQPIDTQSTPSNSGISTSTYTPCANHQMQPISLFARHLPSTATSESSTSSVSVIETTEKQDEGTYEHILNMTVYHTPTAPSLVESTPEQESVLQTKAAKLIQRVTGHTATLLEFDFLRANLKAKKSQNLRPSEDQKEEYISLLGNLHRSIGVHFLFKFISLVARIGSLFSIINYVQCTKA